MIDLDLLCVGYGDTGSTAKDQNEVEVDKLPKAIHATGMQEDYVPFILFGETKFSQPEAIYDIYFSLVYNGFQGVVEYGEDASIERLDYMPKNNFRVMIWNNYILAIFVYLHEKVYY